MKKITSIVLALVMVLSLMTVGMVTVHAEDSKVYFNFYDSPFGYSVYIGTYSGFNSSNYSLDKTIEIPSTYNGRPVTILDRFDPSVPYVFVPGSIKSVNSGCFGSKTFQKIVFDEGVEQLDSGIFMYKWQVTNADISIPSTLKRVGSQTYNMLKDKVSFPEGCQIINDSYDLPISSTNCAHGNYLNEGTKCKSFEYDGILWQVNHTEESDKYSGWCITVANASTEFSKDVVNFPSTFEGENIVATNINCLGYHQSRQNIKTLNLPSNLKVIGDSSFSDLNGLQRIYIPDSVEYIYRYAFQNYRPSNSEGNTANVCMIRLSPNLKYIGDGAFSYRGGCLNAISIPDSVEYIGKEVFQYVGAIRILRNKDRRSSDIWGTLKTIDWNDDSYFDGTYTMEYVEGGVFGGSSRSLQDIVIPSSVKYIGSKAFGNLSNIHSITFENNDIADISSTCFLGTITDELVLTDSVNQSYNRVVPDDSVSVHLRNRNIGLLNYAKQNNLRVVSDDIFESGGSKDSIVTLTTEQANLRVTVPTVLPVSVDSDNNITVATTAQIINSSKGQVDVTNAVLSGNNSWTLAAFDTDFKKVPVDTKQYGFKLQGYSVPVSGNAYNNQFDTIAGNASLDLNYDANVAIQSEATKDAEIGNIVFTVAWHK